MKAQRDASPPTAKECAVQVGNGNRIICPAYPLACSYVRILDPNNVEIAYWDSEEWAEDPQGVMGAIIGAMKKED